MAAQWSVRFGVVAPAKAVDKTVWAEQAVSVGGFCISRSVRCGRLEVAGGPDERVAADVKLGGWTEGWRLVPMVTDGLMREP